jgi:prepilin signal peptidase PulO-like enzyme (type II secretory pathway)
VKLRAVQQRGDGELPLVPFGVFLAPAAVVALLWGTQMIDWYTGTLLGI